MSKSKKDVSLADQTGRAERQKLMKNLRAYKIGS
jgi:hypothetical protein